VDRPASDASNAMMRDAVFAAISWHAHESRTMRVREYELKSLRMIATTNFFCPAKTTAVILKQMGAVRLNAVTTPLLSDFTRCCNELRLGANAGQVDQFWARASVRSLFAAVEATIYEFKLVILEENGRGRLPLLDGEIAVLHDETLELDGDGRVNARPRFLPTERGLRFVLVSIDTTFWR
jgi:hypothetical protein